MHFNQTKPNHDYNININIIATIILIYKYNCYLHFIKTIHLFTSLVIRTHTRKERKTETVCVSVFFAPHSTKNKLIKLNDTIMEINWKRTYCSSLQQFLSHTMGAIFSAQIPFNADFIASLIIICLLHSLGVFLVSLFFCLSFLGTTFWLHQILPFQFKRFEKIEKDGASTWCVENSKQWKSCNIISFGTYVGILVLQANARDYKFDHDHPLR